MLGIQSQSKDADVQIRVLQTMVMVVTWKSCDMTEDTVAQVHDIIQPCTYSGNDKIVAWYAEFLLVWSCLVYKYWLPIDMLYATWCYASIVIVY